MWDSEGRGNGLACHQALTLIEVLVVVAILAIVAMLVGPLMVYHPDRAPQIQCLNNLREMGTSFRLWADENNNSYPMQFVGNTNYPHLTPARSKNGSPFAYAEVSKYFRAMSNELSTTRIVVCPSDSRAAASNFFLLQDINISYFVGQDADASNPKMLLAGDRNLMIDSALAETGILSIYPTNTVTWSRRIHNESGNVTFADGSAQKLSSRQLRAAIQNTGTNVNRLVFP